MKVYLSGPITGLEKEVYTEAFSQAAERISGYQLTPVNPIDLTKHLPEGSEWKEYMKVCIAGLLDCDAIYMLQGWKDSKGAYLEHQLAQGLGLLCMYE